MVDYDLFKSILEKDKKGYIENGDYIDAKVMDLFIKHDIAIIRQLFRVNETSSYFYVDVRCGCCGNMVKLLLSKTKILQHINDIRQNRNKIICDDCHLEAERKRLEQQRKEMEKHTFTVSANTQHYIDIYLDPNNSWKEGIKPYQKRKDLQDTCVDWGKIKDYICEMDYHDFLQTPYWKGIAENVKRFHDYRCQLCDGTEGLSVHHKNYDIHGDEIHHMKDLVCLCKDCHEKFHEVGAYAI